MTKKTFYRVGKEDGSGLWYDTNGNYHGRIHTEELNKLSNNTLPMPFDENVLGYLSATETLEELKDWFDYSDMQILYPLGYRIMKYEADDYKYNESDKHWLINKDTSKLIEVYVDVVVEKSCRRTV